MGRYLLRLHLGVAIDVLHLPIHLRLRGAIWGRLTGGDLAGVHVWLLAVVLLRSQATEGIIWRRHVLGVAWVALLRNVLLGDLAGAGSRDSRSRSLSWSPLCMGGLLAGNDIN